MAMGHRPLTSFQARYLRYVFAVAAGSVVLAWFLAGPLKLMDEWDDQKRWKTAEPARIDADADARHTNADRYDKSYSAYIESAGDLDTSLAFLVALSLFGLVLVTRTDLRTANQEFELPVVGVKLQADWLHLIVPVALLYVWLGFGATLDNLIRERMLLWRLAGYQCDCSSLHSFVRANAMNNAGFLDEWFIQYRPDFHSYDVSPWALRLRWVFLVVAYGGAIALSHAATFTIARLGAERFGESKGFSRCCLWLAWLAPLVVATSHFVFAFAGGNPNRFQYLVAAMTAGASWVFLRFALNPGEGPGERGGAATLPSEPT
jgi:hypothetical protein